MVLAPPLILPVVLLTSDPKVKSGGRPRHYCAVLAGLLSS